ncbi:creatininase family protein [Nonomuraea wenchangensis]|uniref:creatininase family protein n=1 Tax=Nonomuraea wenchangensis TaxID=568860 RepID=UPI0034051EA1
MRSFSLAELSSPEIGRVAASAVLVLPVGAVEQHGAGLPTGTDALVSAEIAHRAAAPLTGVPVLVAPVLPYGSSHHHLPLPGTLSLRSRTLLAVLGDLIESAAVAGFRRIVLFNGHGGNDDLIRQAARDAVLDLPIAVGAASYWSLGGDRLAELAREAGITHVPGHAGAFEAALTLALGATLPAVSSSAPTEPPREPAYGFAMEHGWIARMGGVTDPITPATREVGERLLDHLVTAFTAYLEAFARDFQR